MFNLSIMSKINKTKKKKKNIYIGFNENNRRRSYTRTRFHSSRMINRSHTADYLIVGPTCIPVRRKQDRRDRRVIILRRSLSHRRRRHLWSASGPEARGLPIITYDPLSRQERSYHHENREKEYQLSFDKDRRKGWEEESVGWNPRPPSRSGKVANSFARSFTSFTIYPSVFSFLLVVSLYTVGQNSRYEWGRWNGAIYSKRKIKNKKNCIEELRIWGKCKFKSQLHLTCAFD